MATEKRLIDANALLAILDNSSESWARGLRAIRNWWPHAVGIKDNIVCVINEMPTVDAVEVVRCKDCKYSEPCKPHKKIWCPRIGRYLNADFYCAEGAKKE